MRLAGCVAFSLFCFCLVVGNASRADNSSWREFLSPSGFRIAYPVTWFRIYASPRVLDITSSSRRVEAVVIPDRAQMISVREMAPISNDNYLQAFEQDNPSDQILNSSVKKTKTFANGSTCADIHIIESEDEVGPKAFYREHHMYCKIRNRLFVLSLTQWKADPPNAAAYGIALHMLETLRLQ